MRHALDHFTLLLDSITSPPPYEFSYDTRKRNVPMETSKSAARQTLLDGIARLQDVVPKVNMDESMTLNAITPFLHSYQTTFGREVCSIILPDNQKLIPIYQLWFACLHCVHHWAQVRVIVGEQVCRDNPCSVGTPHPSNRVLSSPMTSVLHLQRWSTRVSSRYRVLYDSSN